MNIAVFGCGAYGIALAKVLFENTNNVTMWTKFEHEKDEIIKTGMNNKVLPNVNIPKEIKITTSIEEACKEKDILIIAIPAAFVCELSKQISSYSKDKIILIASKGIEQHTCLFLNDVIAKHNDTSKLCVMAGGTFAIDITTKTPVGLTLASKNEEAAKIVEKCFENDYFKIRTCADIYGVEICSSIKNVMAIAAGILNGLEVSESTNCMFLTESLHDIMELMDNLGADPKTILSYAGFGDILLTCTCEKSRNFMFGKMFATANKEEIEEYKNTHTIEGLYTLESIHQLVKDKNVDIKIIDLIYDIVLNNKDPKSLLKFLIEKK